MPLARDSNGNIVQGAFSGYGVGQLVAYSGTAGALAGPLWLKSNNEGKMETAEAFKGIDDNLEAGDLPPISHDYVRETPQQSRNRRDVRVYNEARVRIILEDQDGIPPTGQFFGIDGIGYMIRPGVPAEVPVGIVDILNHAVMSTPVLDPVSKQVLRFKDQLRFPYRVLAHIPAGTEVKKVA
jgi:hypothetical protein